MTEKTGAIMKARILAVLADAPSGKSARQIALMLDASNKLMSTRLAELQSAGRVIGVVLPVLTGKTSKLWFAPQFAERAKAAGLAGWAKRSTSIAQAMAPKPMKPAAEPVRITAPPLVDRRFTPERVEPFFSAMEPGSYLRTGSAVERAYMERG